VHGDAELSHTVQAFDQALQMLQTEASPRVAPPLRFVVDGFGQQVDVGDLFAVDWAAVVVDDQVASGLAWT